MSCVYGRKPCGLSEGPEASTVSVYLFHLQPEEVCMSATCYSTSLSLTPFTSFVNANSPAWKKAGDVFTLLFSSDLMYLTHSTAEKEKQLDLWRRRQRWPPLVCHGENSLLSHASKNVISWIFLFFFKQKQIEIVLYTRIRRQDFLFFF